MNALEREVAELRAKLDAIAERVRLDAVAEACLADKHPIREGDFFLLNGTFPTKLGNVSSEGKWTYFDGHGCIEPYRIPDPKDHDRLYTIAEVAEVTAKMRALAQALLDELQAWSLNIDANEDLLRRAIAAGLNTENPR